MMESGRGPGVVGMVLALVVLAIFALLYLFAFDEGMMGTGKTIESVIAGQADQIDNLQFELERHEGELREAELLKVTADKMEAAKAENRNRDERVAALRTEIGAEGDGLSANIAGFEAYVEEYRAHVRDAAKGRILEQLETTEGKVYKDVNILEVTAVGMEIRHEGGLRRIPFEELPEEMQDHFQFDSQQKELALSKELATRNQHEARVDAAKQVARQNAEKNSMGDRRAVEREIAAKESLLRSYAKEILDLESELRREKFKTVSNAPQIRRKLETAKRSQAALRSEVARILARP